MVVCVPAIVSSLRRAFSSDGRRGLAYATLAALCLSSPGHAQTSAWHHDTWSSRYAIHGEAFAHVREAVLDAIAAEGLTAPIESAFSAMLDRTAADLGHPTGLYAEATLFTFCSARLAAQLVQETRHAIPGCPLTLSVYQLADEPATVHIAYRRPPASAGGAAITALLQRITERAAAELR